MIHVRHDQIEPPVLIIVGGIYAHARSSETEWVITDTGERTNFFKVTLTVIGKEKIGYRVVCNKQIHPSVVVNIRGHYAPRLAH